MRAVVTVLGRDKVGIIAAVSAILAAGNVNILDISQTTMQDIFSMVMMVDISSMKCNFEELSDKFAQKGEEMALQIKIQHEAIFNSMHRI